MRTPWVILLALLAALAAAFVVSGGDPLSLLDGGRKSDEGEGDGSLVGESAEGGDAAAAGTSGGPRLSGIEGVRRRGEGAVRGRVVDVGSGKPVAKAALLLTGPPGGKALVAMNAQSAEDGTFTFLEVPAGDGYALRLEAEKVGARNLVGIAVNAGGVNDLGDLWLGHAGTIEGVVLDMSGQPVSRADVQLHRGGSSARDFLMRGGFIEMFSHLDRVPEPQTRQETGPQGTFRFEGVSPGPHTLLVRAPGFRQAIVPVTLAGDGGTQKATVRLSAGATISGQVVDASGRGLAGATVVAMPAEGGMPTPLTRTFATTGGDGAFRFDALAGDSGHMLIAAATSYPNTFTEAEAGESGVRIVMKRGATLELVLVVDEGSVPIAGAEVLVAVGAAATMDKGPETLVVGQTDATGTAVLEVCPGVVQMMLMTHPDRPSSFWAARMGGPQPGAMKGPEDATVREGRTRLVFRAPQGVVIVGRVLDPDGRPLVGAEVSTMSMMGSPASCVSDVDGGFRLPADPMMLAALQTRLPGWVQEKTETPEGASAEVAPGGEKRLDVRMRRAAAVGGRVLAPDGQPLAGADVVARVVNEDGQAWMDPSSLFGGAPTSITLSDGSYVIEGLPTGRKVRIVAHREGYVDTGAKPVKVADGGVTPAGDIRMLAGATLEVRVLAHDGTPASGAHVRLSVDRTDDVKGSDFESLMEDVSGRHDVRANAAGEVGIPLVPPGRVTLRVSAPGSAPGGANVEVTEKGGPSETVVVRLEPGQTLSGRVLDADGQPLAGVRVQVINAPGGGAEVGEAPAASSRDWSSEWDRARSATTDAQGAWRVADLPLRPLRVQVRKDGFHTVKQDVGAQRDGIEVRLVPQSGDAKARIAEIDRELAEIWTRMQAEGADKQALMQQLQALQQERTSLAGDN